METTAWAWISLRRRLIRGSFSVTASERGVLMTTLSTDNDSDADASQRMRRCWFLVWRWRRVSDVLHATSLTSSSEASKYRFDIGVSYRIVSPAEISKFSTYRCRLFDMSSCRSFSESFDESFNENFTTFWHHTVTTRENSIRESLNFSLWENFVKFYITT